MRQIKPLMDALKVHSKHYVPLGDYSVTGLIDTPRRIQLMKRHADNLIITPESQAASFIGTGVHAYWEHCLKQYAMVDHNYEIERRLTSFIQDRMISGRFDILYDLKHMYDIKTCKVWKLIFDPHMEEWTQQQNFYAYLLGRMGIKVESSHVIAQYLDWIEAMSIRDQQYPREAVEMYEIKLWTTEEQEFRLNDRIAVHKAAENLADIELPICSKEERWETPTKYAILKARTANRAINNGVFDTLDDAVKRFMENPKGITSESVIEIRNGQRKRCEKWCSCSHLCSDYIEWTGKVNDGKTNEYLTYDQIYKGQI